MQLIDNKILKINFSFFLIILFQRTRYEKKNEIRAEYRLFS